MKIVIIRSFPELKKEKGMCIKKVLLLQDF